METGMRQHREDTIGKLKQIKGFISCRAGMAMPGEASALLYGWGKALEEAIEILEAVNEHEQ